MEHYQRRIILQAVIGILITGILIGVSSTLPRYLAARNTLEQLTSLDAASLRDTLDQRLQRYRDLALQTASRSEIRRRLLQYAQGTLSFDELHAYTAPRLEDALSHMQTLIAARRLGPHGEAVLTYGTVPAASTTLPTQATLELAVNGDQVMVVASAPILGPDNTLIGADQLFFGTTEVAQLLRADARFGDDSRLLLQPLEGDMALIPSQGERLQPVPLPERLAALENGSASPLPILQLDDNEGRHTLFQLPLESLKARLLLSIPSASLHAPARRELLWTLVYILLMMAVGSLFTALALRPVTRRLTKQTRQLEASGAELRLAASVFERAQEAIVITDASCRILRVNGAFAQICGQQTGRVLGQYLYDLFDPDYLTPGLHETVFKQLQEQDVWQGEIWYRRTNQPALPALQSISAVRDSSGRIIRLIHIFNDISEHKDNENQIRRLAHYDALTGLANRAMLLQRLETVLSNDQRLGKGHAILFVDLDHFKPVNDHFGHHIGDELLKAVAKRMEHALREDDLLARFGGDEFLVLLGGPSPADYAAVVASKLIQLVSQPYQFAGQEIRIGASIGIALYPQDASDPQQLLHLADQAMYEAKQRRRGSYRFASGANALEQQRSAQ